MTHDERGTNWSRRNVMRVGGAGVGIAGVAGAGLAAGGDGSDDERSEGGDETTTDGETTTGGRTTTDGTDDDAVDDPLVDDLIDPVFGYPLAAGEASGLAIETVVELHVEEGDGAHDSFPLEPDPETEGEFVEVPAEFYFDPVGIQLQPGELVHFADISGVHTVTAFHEKFSEPEFELPTRIPDGAPGFTSPPTVGGESWLYQFPSAGVYDLLCLPHLGLGMVMRVVVTDPDEDDAFDAFDAPEAGSVPPNAESVLNAEELAPSNVVEQGTVAWADLTLEAPGDGSG